MPTVSRRDAILGGACAATVAVALPLAASARAPLTVSEFRALSAALTGMSPADLDVTAAHKLLTGFLSIGRGDDLASLAADPGKAGTLANEIVAAWYSGNFATGEGLEAFDVTDALVWEALDFTKPPGLCGGDTGHWSDPPPS
jgi:hypothetical protein